MKKEVTYGWYPSANDVYRSKGRPSTAHLECLYNGTNPDSMYYQAKMAAPPSELMVCGVATGGGAVSDDQRRRRSRTVPVPKFKPIPKLNLPTPAECWSKSPSTHKGVAETAWGVTGDSTCIKIPSENNWPFPADKLLQQQQQPTWRQHYSSQKQQQQLLKTHQQNQRTICLMDKHPTPQYAWGIKNQTSTESPRSPRLTSASVKWPSARPPAPSRPHTASSVGRSSSPKSQKHRPATSHAASSNDIQADCRQMTPLPPGGMNNAGSKRPQRIQSATYHREKTPLPARPMTASPRKEEFQTHPTNSSSEDLASRITRPAVPVPFIHDVNDCLTEDVAVDDDETAHTADFSVDDEYEEVMKTFGWRAQIQGDPYGLKPIAPRLSYNVKCHIPEVPPEPPSVYMETNAPFFYNTIPTQPMAITVHKQWLSEAINAKRLELQKRDGGIKYNYKKFSFVY